MHLVDGAGNLLAQADSPPLSGSYDTNYWWPGDRIRDPHAMAVPAEALGVPLTLRVGLYLPATGARVVPGESGGVDYVELGPFSIGASGTIE